MAGPTSCTHALRMPPPHRPQGLPMAAYAFVLLLAGPFGLACRTKTFRSIDFIVRSKFSNHTQASGRLFKGPRTSASLGGTSRWVKPTWRCQGASSFWQRCSIAPDISLKERDRSLTAYTRACAACLMARSKAWAN